jgi:hypothetical protein
MFSPHPDAATGARKVYAYVKSTREPTGLARELHDALEQELPERLLLASVDTDDNFFDLGGTSLQLVKVHATIPAMMHLDVTIVDLFQQPRIRALPAGVLQRSEAMHASALSRS